MSNGIGAHQDWPASESVCPLNGRGRDLASVARLSEAAMSCAIAPVMGALEKREVTTEEAREGVWKAEFSQRVGLLKADKQIRQQCIVLPILRCMQ